MGAGRVKIAEAVDHLAAKSGLTVEQVRSLLQAQAESAYEFAGRGFPIPGVGVFVVTERPERKMVMRFGPQKGQEITVRARRQINFRVSNLAKGVILGTSQPMPDLFKPSPLSELRFSSDATELSDGSMFIADMGGPFTLVHDGKRASITVYRLPDLKLPTGHIQASDGLLGREEPFSRSVPAGRFPLAVVVAGTEAGERVAFAVIRFADNPAVSWELAGIAGQSASKLDEGSGPGYPVDSGTGSFSDASVQRLVDEMTEADGDFNDMILAQLRAAYENKQKWVHVETPLGSLAIFSSGYGDGRYPSYFGLDESGKAVALVTDFKIVKWAAMTV